MHFQKRTRAGEPENGDDEIVNDPPPTITSKKRKIPDDDASSTAKFFKKRKFPDRTRTAADESMTQEPDDENSENHVTASLLLARVLSCTVVHKSISKKSFELMLIGSGAAKTIHLPFLATHGTCGEITSFIFKSSTLETDVLECHRSETQSI